jgi:hypothetical protein
MISKHNLVLPDYYRNYVNSVPEQELLPALEGAQSVLRHTDTAVLQQLGDKVYAPGKWTIRDIYQHIADCERIMAYRALRFARNDKSLLPSFDEDAFAAEAGATQRSLESILAELEILRESTLQVFRSFHTTALERCGTCMGQETSVAGLGFVIAGHQAHHLRIIAERYLPLLN